MTDASSDHGRIAAFLEKIDEGSEALISQYLLPSQVGRLSEGLRERSVHRARRGVMTPAHLERSENAFNQAFPRFSLLLQSLLTSRAHHTEFLAQGGQLYGSNVRKNVGDDGKRFPDLRRGVERVGAVEERADEIELLGEGEGLAGGGGDGG